MRKNLIKDRKLRLFWLAAEASRGLIMNLYKLTKRTRTKKETSLLNLLTYKRIFPTRIRNVCNQTGRAHAVLKKYKLSRLALSNHIANGHILHLKHASW